MLPISLGLQPMDLMTFNQRVVGSNPAAPTKPTKGLRVVEETAKYFWQAQGEHLGKFRDYPNVFNAFRLS